MDQEVLVAQVIMQRKELKLTKVQLAMRLDINPKTITRYEKGQQLVTRLYILALENLCYRVSRTVDEAFLESIGVCVPKILWQTRAPKAPYLVYVLSLHDKEYEFFQIDLLDNELLHIDCLRAQTPSGARAELELIVQTQR